MFSQLIANGLIAGSIYALIALGFALIYRTVKFFHFAHGVVYTAAAYMAYAVVMNVGIGVAPSFFLSALRLALSA